MKQGKMSNPEGGFFFLSVWGLIGNWRHKKNSGSLLAEKGIEKLQES